MFKKDFHRTNKFRDAKYCSQVCYKTTRKGENNNKWKGGQITLNCSACEKQFKVDLYRKKAKTCSITCNKIYRQSVEFRLNLSKIQRDALPEHQKDLTKLLTDFRQIVRESARYKIWRSEIMKRDGYVCQMCNIKGKRLCVDHIKSFAEIIRDENIKSNDDAQKNEKLWDINNGRTLCYPCHKLTPSYGWKALKLLSKIN